MNRLNLALSVLIVVSLSFLASCASTHTCHHGVEKRDIIYFCDCGADCKCDKVSKEPGKCGCGKDMVGGHVLKIEGDEALVCVCGPDCTCKLDPNDPAKCGCGKTVKRVSLKGTGLYFCNCGGTCFCNTVSDKPDTCKCGMPLHQAK